MSKKAKAELNVVWEQKCSPELEFRLFKALSMLIGVEDLNINYKDNDKPKRDLSQEI